MTGFPSAPRNFAAFNGFGTDVASAALPATLANSLIIAGFSAQLASGTVPSVTDSAGNSYAMAPLLAPGVSQRHAEIWWAQIPAAGITGATVHAGATSVNVAGVLLEVPVDKPVRQRDTGSRANTSSATPAAATAVAAIGDFLLGILAYQATVSSTQQEHLTGVNGFTTLNRVTRGTTNMFASAYRIAAAAGATGPTWTMDDGAGTATAIATGEVTCAFTIAPVFTATPAGLTVALDASGATLPGGDPVVSYAWDYGDGQTGSGVSPSHTYGTAGAKTITLTATYSSGDTGTLAQTVTLAAPAQTVTPVAVVSATGWAVTGAGGNALTAVSDADQSTHADSPVPPTSAIFRVRLGALVSPLAGTNMIIGPFECDVTGGTGTLSAKLYEGTTVRATAAAQTLAVATAGSNTTATLTFTFAAASIANVTNWNALELELTATAA